MKKPRKILAVDYLIRAVLSGNIVLVKNIVHTKILSPSDFRVALLWASTKENIPIISYLISYVNDWNKGKNRKIDLELEYAFIHAKLGDKEESQEFLKPFVKDWKLVKKVIAGIIKRQNEIS